MTNNVLRERIRAGAALLDAEGPQDWRDRIDTDELDMFYVTHCVLGQLFGDYTSGVNALTGTVYRGLESFRLEWAVEHGFEASTMLDDDHEFNGHGSYRYADLDAAWREELSSVPV